MKIHPAGLPKVNTAFAYFHLPKYFTGKGGTFTSNASDECWKLVALFGVITDNMDYLFSQEIF